MAKKQKSPDEEDEEPIPLLDLAATRMVKRCDVRYSKDTENVALFLSK